MPHHSNFTLALAQADRAVVAANSPTIAYILMFVALGIAALIVARNLLRSRSPLMRLAWCVPLACIVVIAIVMILN